MSENPLDEITNKVFDLTAFLAVSARGTMEEGVYSGSLRLINAIRKMAAAFPQSRDDPFLRRTVDFIDSRLEKDYHESEQKYILLLDEIVSRYADEILNRNGVKDRRPLSEKKRGTRKRRSIVRKKQTRIKPNNLTS